MYLKCVFIVLVFANICASYQNAFNMNSRCCSGIMQWQYIPYYPEIQMINSVYWPYVQYPIHHLYFKPPLSYHYYNPCVMIQPHCYELTKIYKCCVDYCGRTKCEQIYDCEIETIGSGDGPESDEEVTKCVEPEVLDFFDDENINVDTDYYNSDFVFDN